MECFTDFCIFCNKKMIREIWEDECGYTQVVPLVCSPECARELIEAFKASKVAMPPEVVEASFTYGSA